MTPLSRILWRLLVAAFGVLAAVLASVIVTVVGFGTLGAGERLVGGDAAALPALFGAVMRSGVVLPVLAAIVWPAWGLAALAAEGAAARGFLTHVVGAAGIAVVALVGTVPMVGLGQVQAVAMLGLVAGFVHWAIAGRNAGFGAPIRRDGLEGDPRPAHDGSAKSEVIERRPPP